MKYLFALILSFAFAALAWADAPTQLATDATSFLSEVIAYIHSFGGQTWLFKVSSLIMLVVAVVKVTPLSALWAKMEGKQIWVAPVLGLAYGVFSLALTGSPITLAAVMAYVTAGGGAVFLHELLDLVKLIPGIGPFWVSMIGVVENALGGAKAGA